MVKNYLFTSESVSEGHPDKVADQISDAVLDAFLSQDPEAKVACESFCTTGMVVVMGEVRSNIRVDVETIARNTIRNIGYTKSDYRFDADGCGVLSALHGQSDDIDRGVSKEDQGAGDQGMMFGYACRETEDYMPLPLYLNHRILKILSEIRHNEPDVMPYLRPDSKSQFTVEYDGTTHKPVKVHTIVISTQHDQFDTDEAMQLRIRQDVENILIPRFKAALAPETAALIHDYELLVNPTGKFVIGGP
ncbi:MAG: methionine adenosyltransferase, partial [Bacteroidales bacterium]|nr:methionine adenosyltransferase [Bacteroidales bacterium]